MQESAAFQFFSDYLPFCPIGTASHPCYLQIRDTSKKADIKTLLPEGITIELCAEGVEGVPLLQVGFFSNKEEMDAIAKQVQDEVFGGINAVVRERCDDSIHQIERYVR